MSFAVLGPMPLTLRNTASSSRCTASATCSGESADSTPSADLGPTPVTPMSRSNTSSSSRVPNPNRVSESSRTISVVCTLVSVPSRLASASAGVVLTWKPTPPTSSTMELPPAESTRPRREEITPSAYGPPPTRAAERSAASHARWAGVRPDASAGAAASLNRGARHSPGAPGVADRECERIGRVGGLRHRVEPEDAGDHRADLLLVGTPVAR